MSSKPRRMLPLLLLAVPAFAIAGTLVLVLLSRSPGEVGVVEGALRPCPDKPNCVCSTATDERHAIEPFALDAADPVAAFARLVTVASEQGDAALVTQEEGYAHLVFTTPLLRFQDDVELLLDEEGARAHVRSASRVGHSDLDANRMRINALRKAWEGAESSTGSGD